MKILISGGSGLLGHAVVNKLAHNNKIYVLNRNINQTFNTSKNIEYIYCDLSSELSNTRFPKNLDVIIHLAQSNFYKNFPSDVQNIFDINIQSTQQLLNLGLKTNIKHFIFTSSGSVYEPYINLNEYSFLNPSSYYANSKLIGERLVRSYGDFFNTSILRLFFLYGPHPHNKQTLINAMIKKIINQETIIIDGKPKGMIFTPTLTIDIANFLEKYLQSNQNGIYNIANPKSYSLLDIIEVLSKKLGLDVEIEFNSDKEPLNIIPNLEKMKHDFPNFNFHSFQRSLNYLFNNQ